MPFSLPQRPVFTRVKLESQRQLPSYFFVRYPAHRPAHSSPIPLPSSSSPSPLFPFSSCRRRRRHPPRRRRRRCRRIYSFAGVLQSVDFPNN